MGENRVKKRRTVGRIYGMRVERAIREINTKTNKQNKTKTKQKKRVGKLGWFMLKT